MIDCTNSGSLSLGFDIPKAGNAKDFKTGDWRGKRYPVTDYDKCIKCGLCWILCPDIAYDRNVDGYYIWNSFYCKGCGICIKECPKQAITWEKEK